MILIWNICLLPFSHINNIKRDIELIKTVTSIDRGTSSERDLILQLLKYGINSSAIFHDLYIKKINGNFSQIDLVMCSKVGIIVFEVKDYSGWIFGNGKQIKWTEVLAYGNDKYRFYNPIIQNNRHIMYLKNLLSSEKVPFYSVIVFYGDCELKDISFVPKGTFITKDYKVIDVVDTIINSNEDVEYKDKYNVIHLLLNCVKNGQFTENQDKHIENIKDMLGENRVFY